MKTKKQKREAAIKYMQDAKSYSLKAVAKRFNIPYSTVWSYSNSLKKTKKPEVKVHKTPASMPLERALKLVSDGSTATYYVLPKDANELQDLISHKNMNSQIGEIFRSCYRYGEVSHSDKLRDAKKIKFYAEAEIKRLEKLNENKD